MKSIIIAGPTASGKTRIGIELAEKLGGEIISCDSMQVYRDIPICSAAATKQEQLAVPHHLIGFLPFDAEFSVVDWRNMALKKMDEIASRGKLPIFVGGTGMYVHSLIYDTDFNAPKDEAFRNSIKALSTEELYARVKAVDENTALSQNDRVRLSRFLEVVHITGKAPEKNKWKKPNSQHEFLLFCITPEREALYQRINQRVDIMLQQGLEDEIRKLYSLGINENHQPYKAIGCRQLIDYFNSKVTFEEAIENVKRESRRYAKRQLTWMRGEPTAVFIENPSADKFMEVIRERNFQTT